LDVGLALADSFGARCRNLLSKAKGVTVDDLSYPECTRVLFESEILGEAVFRGLVAEAKNPRERYHLGTLLQLETETKARLRPLLYKHGVSLDEEVDFSLLDIVGTTYKESTWPEFAAANIPILEDFIRRFEAIAKIGDEDDRDILDSMVRHEASILRWATMESAGRTDGSLDDVIEQLVWPLDRL